MQRLCVAFFLFTFAGTAVADDEATPSATGDPTEAPAPPPPKKKKHKKKHVEAPPADEATPAETASGNATAGTTSAASTDEGTERPPRVTAAAELLGAAPLDRANREAFGTGGGVALGAELYLAPLLGLHVAGMFLYLSKDQAMSSTKWLAAQLGPRVHWGQWLFGGASHDDAWVDAHVTYGESGGIRRPGFDLGATVEWEVSPALRLGPMLRYQFGSDPRDKNAQLFTAGLAVAFGGRQRIPLGHAGPPRDGDEDGVPDAADQCPDDPAGVNPDPARAGCPNPDRDGDGLLDAQDECPDVAAGKTPDPARAGCPFVDTDGDHIPDADDKCPKAPGPPNPFDPAHHGCPTLARVTDNKIEILQQIFFETDQATIKDESFPVLQAVASVLKGLGGARVRIEGHTDDRGSDEYNLDLSKRRARAVAQWLISNGGVDAGRLETEGYGKTRPIVSGPNVDVSMNRRVEFILISP